VTKAHKFNPTVLHMSRYPRNGGPSAATTFMRWPRLRQLRPAPAASRSAFRRLLELAGAGSRRDRGLRDCGLDVWRAGLGPTPLLYYATLTQGAAGGIMITGSHNPPDQNGFKMMLGKAAFYGDAIQELGRMAASTAYAEGPRGAVRERRVFDAYIERLAAGLTDAGPSPRPLTVAWDAGNGAAGEAMVALTKRLPGRHFLLNETIDGRFPNHHPDPTVPENLVQLIECVRANNCDLGIAFDGDGDRVGAVDGQGRVVWADQMMILFAREILKARPGATIISDVKAANRYSTRFAPAASR
jgi:phosphomannomutase